MRTIFYFHGYGSTPNSDKVARLKAAFPDDSVYAFPVPLDPVDADIYLTSQIIMALVDNLHSDGPTVFVGTSLGAYWAGRLAKDFGVPSILINPAIDPATTLEKYGVSPETRAKFSKMPIEDSQIYFFAVKDDVIDNLATHEILMNREGIDTPMFWFKDETHRFDGPGFDRVFDVISSLK